MKKTEQLQKAFNEKEFRVLAEYAKGINLKKVSDIKNDLIITVGQEQSNLEEREIDFQDLIDGIQTLAHDDLICLINWESEPEVVEKKDEEAD